MSTIAQRLCDEIVDPTLKQSSEKCDEPRSSHCTHNSSRQNGKTTKTVVVEKKKVINKVLPSDSVGSRSIINQYKSKEILLKKRLRDVAINTLISGPLRCDNDCITLVRKKDDRKFCKCSNSNKQRVTTSIKETQTIGVRELSFTDKASDKHVETLNRSTQFLDPIEPGQCTGMTTARPVTTMKKEDSQSKHGKSSSSRDSSGSKITWKSSSNTSRPKFHSYMGARRWALSKYPNRGPDF